MPQTCKVCRHPKRAEVNRRLVKGEALRHIASHVGVGYQSVKRHRDACLPALLAKVEDREVTDAEVLIEDILEQKEIVVRLREEAEEQNDLRTALQAVDKSLKCLELQAKVSEVIASSPTVNLVVNPQWIALRDTIFEVLDPHPDIALELSARLLAIEEGSARP